MLLLCQQVQLQKSLLCWNLIILITTLLRRFLTPKLAILFWTIMISPWHRLILAKNQHLIALLRNRGSLNYWLCNHKFPTPMVLHLSSFNTITDYLKACRNLRSETQKMQMLAETMAATFRKENERCFTCGDKNHLGTALRRLIKNLQKFALTAIEKYIGPKTVNLNLILKEKLFQETPSRNTQVPFNKNQGHILSFPSNPQHPAVLPSIYQP